jgi:cell division protein ZapE
MPSNTRSGPEFVYRAALEEGTLDADARQREVVAKLQHLHDALLQKADRSEQVTSDTGIAGALRRLFSRQPEASVPSIKGLYLWGGVGRGKTLLCDMFFENLPIERKHRVHFHRFMQGVHEALRDVPDEQSPLELIAENYAARFRLLVLDEMHINDITDAMLMSGLLNGLFRRGVVIVTTSNSLPDDLYKDGLQRARFLPAIEALKKHTDVVHLGGDMDYRLRVLESAQIYHTPIDADGEQLLVSCFKQAVSPAQFEADTEIEINGRNIKVRQVAEHVVWFEYSELCMTARSTADYIEIARRFETVLIGGIQKMDTNSADVARRFINLIDEFYDRNVKIVVTAAVVPELLYEGERLSFEFERTISRLREMQSRDYLSSKHLQ